MKRAMFIALGVIVGVGVLFTTVSIVRTLSSDTLPATTTNNSSSQLAVFDTVAYKTARRLPADTKPCLKANNALNISAKERQDIEMAAMNTIYDVPAGVEVDIRIATYGDGLASGSAIYPGDFGTYNFTATDKLSDSPVSGPENFKWQPTSLRPCKV